MRTLLSLALLAVSAAYTLLPLRSTAPVVPVCRPAVPYMQVCCKMHAAQIRGKAQQVSASRSPVPLAQSRLVHGRWATSLFRWSRRPLPMLLPWM